jgi:hypothetical protein
MLRAGSITASPTPLTRKIASRSSQKCCTSTLGGVFPLLYEVLAAKKMPIQKVKKGKPKRRIVLKDVYDRLFDVGAEYGLCKVAEQNCFCIASAFATTAVDGAAVPTFVMSAEIKSLNGTALEARRKLPPFPGWRRDSTNPLRWSSPSQIAANPGAFNQEASIARQYLSIPHPSVKGAGRFTLPLGRFAFTDEMPIFLAFYHLSSIVRYKPKFLDTIQDSDAWPVVLAARRHLLYHALLLTLSSVFQTNMQVVIA